MGAPPQGFGAPPNGPPQGMPPHMMGMAPQGMPMQPPGPNDMQQGAPPPMPAAPAQPKQQHPVYPPNQSLYLNNLSEKIKIDELKKALFHVFSQFGNIIEINAHKDLKRRGQAWVVFETTESASKALGEMEQFSFYSKPMHVAFARIKSDVVSKKDGSFEARAKRKVEKKRKGKRKKGEKSKKEKKRKTEEGDAAAAAAPPTEEVAPPLPGAPMMAVPTPVAGPVAPRPPAPVPTQAPAPPNRILFVENLPVQCTNNMLSMLFNQYPGFKEARLVNGKPGIAFVEFDDAARAIPAKTALHHFKITPTNNMKVTFARQ